MASRPGCGRRRVRCPHWRMASLSYSISSAMGSRSAYHCWRNVTRSILSSGIGGRPPFGPTSGSAAQSVSATAPMHHRVHLGRISPAASALLHRMAEARKGGLLGHRQGSFVVPASLHQPGDYAFQNCPPYLSVGQNRAVMASRVTQSRAIGRRARGAIRRGAGHFIPPYPQNLDRRTQPHQMPPRGGGARRRNGP